jgi:hypothetical protein
MARVVDSMTNSCAAKSSVVTSIYGSEMTARNTLDAPMMSIVCSTCKSEQEDDGALRI